MIREAHQKKVVNMPLAAILALIMGEIKTPEKLKTLMKDDMLTGFTQSQTQKCLVEMRRSGAVTQIEGKWALTTMGLAASIRLANKISHLIEEKSKDS